MVNPQYQYIGFLNKTSWWKMLYESQAMCQRIWGSSKTESPTCSRESVHLAITFITSNKWNLNAIDIKTSFLQGKKIDRTVIIKPPEEAQTNKLWKLNKCVYGLADTPRCWYLRLKEELLKLIVTISKYVPALFYYTKDNKLQGLMVCFVDDILWGGTGEFKAD